MSPTTPDVIDLLVGITPGSPLDAIRGQRVQARDNAQTSFLSLFEPATLGDVSLTERFAVALFVAELHRQPEIAGFYAKGLEARQGGGAIAKVLRAEMLQAMGQGPYGKFPAGPLSTEDSAGSVYLVQDRAALGDKLSAALEHAHMLVFHPRDADPEALQKLLNAGWSTTGIVTFSQLVAFLSFQIRVVVGLRSLAAAA